MQDINGYKLIREIGRGGQAILWQGQTPEGKNCAAKEYKVGDGGEHEFEMLQKVLQANGSALAHVVEVFGYTVTGERYFLVEELLATSLQDQFSRFPMTGPALMHVGIDTSRALVEIFRAGLVHCDFKPDNILYSLSRRRVVVSDLGIAVLFGQPKRGESEFIAAPELVQGTASPTSDCYQWARVMELLLARRCDIGPKYRLSDFPHLGWVSQGFSDIVRQCTSSNPAERPTPDRLAVSVMQALTNVDVQNGFRYRDAREASPSLMKFIA